METKRVKLGDLCFKITDGSHNPPKGIECSEYLMLSSKNVFDDSIHLEKPRYLSEFDFLKENKRTDVSEGDVLLTIVGTVGRVAVVDSSLPKFTLQRSVAVLKPVEDKISSRYLMYCLQSILEELLGEARGVAQKGIYLKSLRSMEINVPPIPEQKRIVAILDQAFADIEQARAKTEQNLKNTRELFESYLQQVFSQRGEGWAEKTLGNAVTVERGSSPRPIKNFQTDDVDGVNWIKIGDTKQGQKYIERTKEKITKEGAEKSRFVDVGDFILSNSMSFGRPYIMAIQGYIHDGWFVLRLPEDIDSEYFYYLLSSPYLKDQFQSLAAGAIVKNISGDLVKKAILPIPPFQEQKEIAKKLALLADQMERLKEIYLRKASNIDELKKSILQKAFSGELATTPDNDTSKGAAA
jgi:type I restriction enzyme S subunit